LDDGDDLLDTPQVERSRWVDGAPETPVAARPKRSRPSTNGSKGGVTLTLRDQEKVCSEILCGLQE
jgi:hypothetical protein